MTPIHRSDLFDILKLWHFSHRLHFTEFIIWWTHVMNSNIPLKSESKLVKYQHHLT